MSRPGTVFQLPDPRVAAAKAGDASAFEALYRGHVGRVYAMCLRLAGDEAAAEELTQRAFVRAWERLSTFRGEAAFGTWLHRLAANVCLEHLRGAARDRVRTQDELAERIAPDAPPGARLDLERAIARLPPSARQVLVLHDIEGWPHDEIAESLGVTVGTTKSQLHRARALLREVLR